MVQPIRPLRTTRHLVADAAASGHPFGVHGGRSHRWRLGGYGRRDATRRGDRRGFAQMARPHLGRRRGSTSSHGYGDWQRTGRSGKPRGDGWPQVCRRGAPARALKSPARSERKLSEYLRAVDQLSGSERLGSRMYAKQESGSTAVHGCSVVFPIWALTTLTARSNLPLRAGLFDLLIIDEASQCDLPSAFPLLARAKRVVIIGDDKQLIHVTPLRAETEQAFAAEHELTPEELVDSYRQVSLFTLARHIVSTVPTMTLLDEHYRSHPDIIGFSNDRFYGGRLNVFTEPEQSASRRTPITPPCDGNTSPGRQFDRAMGAPTTRLRSSVRSNWLWVS